MLAAAAKHIVQILDLLDERCMNYTFPVSKQDVLLNAGFSILWQCTDLEDDSKIIKDNQKSLTLLLAKIAKENMPVGSEFQKVARAFVTLGTPRTMQSQRTLADTPPARLPNNTSAPTAHKSRTPKKQLQAIASKISSFAKDKPEIQPRRRTQSQEIDTSNLTSNPFPRNISSLSLISTQSAPTAHMSLSSPKTPSTLRPMGPAASVMNLDYFPFEASLQPYPTGNSSSTILAPRKTSSPGVDDRNLDAWEHITTVYDTLATDAYSTMQPVALDKCISNPELDATDWNIDSWQLTDLWTGKAHVPQSLLSFSEESMTSGDDFVFSTAGSSHHGSVSTASPDAPTACDELYKGIAIPIGDGDGEDRLGFSPGGGV